MENLRFDQRLLRSQIIVWMLIIACVGTAIVFAALGALRVLMFMPYLVVCNFYWAILLFSIGQGIRRIGIAGTVSKFRWILVATCTAWLVLSFVFAGRSYHAPEQTYSGSTENLRETCVLPTLDSPLPPDKSAVWCASFELAWKRAQSDVIKAPIQIQNAQPICDRLNASPTSEKDLESTSFCALAGFMKDKIGDKIASELHSKFPQVTPSSFDAPGDAVIAYSYLSLSVPFELPYFDSTKALVFADAGGKKTSVMSFGIRQEDDYAYPQLRGQATVLFSTPGRDPLSLDEFAVDPCSDSKPYQIVLAAVKPQSTLTETLARIDKLTAESEKGDYYHRIGPNDVLLIPSHHWDLAHRFRELEGNVLTSSFSGYKVAEALESIRFKLDRSGAELSAESKLHMLPIPKLFIFNRPHLVYIKKRGCERPIFVMWVANAELLDKW